jgi:prepilin-type N-terminal cleavage/methylation domain-containing protein
MNLNKNAFTLIELLVVVLIIGILAAIALPIYKNAVERTYFAEASVILKAAATAEDIYFLTHGRYASSFADLDFSVPGGGKIVSCYAAKDCYEFKNFYYSVYYDHPPFLAVQARRRGANGGADYQNYSYLLAVNDLNSIVKKGQVYCGIVTFLSADLEKDRAFCKKISGSAAISFLGGENYLMK